MVYWRASLKCNPGDQLDLGTTFRFLRRADTLTAMFPCPAKATWIPSLLLGGWLASVVGCRSAGQILQDMLRERPPAPLDSMSVASDARVDSLGYLVGSFVGEGTSRAVHLLSSDTGFIAALARRYRPNLARTGNLWGELANQRVLSLAPAGRRRSHSDGPHIDRALVGGPTGHTSVTPTAMLVHGSSCGWRGAQFEIILEDERRAQYPTLRGPVLGSFSRPDSSNAAGDARWQSRLREQLPEPGETLVDDLMSRTSRVMDSTLNSRFRSLRLNPPGSPRIEINTLADVDAVDVISYRPKPQAVRYAVSLRARRITSGGDTLLASTVMAWDSAGAWQQVIFRPTLISLRRGRLVPYPAFRRSLFWRRLQPISDFGFERDNLWMEQVDVRTGGVLWGVIQPRGNVVVAAAEVEGACR